MATPSTGVGRGVGGGPTTKYKDYFPNDIISYFLMQEEFPTFAGFATECDCTMECLHEWQRKYPKFSEAYKKAKQIQENRTIQGAMSNTLNSTFSIFFLKNCHGYKDKVEQEISGLESIVIDIVKPRKKRGES